MKRIITGILIATAFTGWAERPNFLILMTDDQRRETMGCYAADCPIETPNLDRLAADGIRFDEAFVTTPICVVSRASILTGRYGCNTRVYQFQVPLADDVFAESYPVYLKQAGYFLGMYGKYGIGVTPQVEKTFDAFEAQATQGPTFRYAQGHMVHDAEWLTLKAAEFFDRLPEGKPFCLQLNYKEPHPSSVPAPKDDHVLDQHIFPRHPLDAPEYFAALPEYVQHGFGREMYETEFNKDGDHNPWMRQYYEKILSVERSVGKIRSMLEARGLADNTVILFLSDHGTLFGEHQLSHKWTPYDGTLRIPFIIYDPRPQAPKGSSRRDFVLNIDVAPTLLSLAGLPVPDIMDGESLVPVIQGDASLKRDQFPYEHYTSPAPIRYIPRNEGVRSKTFNYIRWLTRSGVVEELYDLTEDPLQKKNRAQSSEYTGMLQRARRMFEQWRAENPSTYQVDSYGFRAQFGANEMDWNRFKTVRPVEYARIAAEVKRLGINWKQALDDWKIRTEICTRAGYWY